MEKNMRSKKIWATVAISLFAAVSIGLFAPLEIFITNIDYFWFDIYHTLPIVLLVTGCIFIGILAILGVSFRVKFFDIIVWIITSLFLALYIQGNFILEDYGPLNGIEINWSEYSKEKWISWIVWIAVFGIVGVIIKKTEDKKYTIISVLLGCLILLQISTLFIIAVQNDVRKSSATYIVTDQNMWDYSSKNNFIILLLDYYDSEAFDYIINNPEGIDYENMFDGFTFYRNTLGSYNCTDMAIPQILTGEGYDNTQIFGQYLRKAYKESPLFNELGKDDYEMNIYTTSMLPEDEFAVDSIANYQINEELQISSKRKFIELMYKLVGFRYFPQPVKKAFWFYPDEIR